MANTDSASSDACKMCRERGKTWPGSDPKCAFPDGGEFTHDNWNCATANAIRDIAESDRGDVVRVYIGDQTSAMVALDSDWPTLDGIEANTLWLTWYKRRGCTGGMWLLGDEDDPPARRPTEAECVAIIMRYRATP